MTRAATAKAIVLDNLEQLLHELAPGGVSLGGTYAPLNPTRADKSPGSFLIWLRGEGRGAWWEYATGEHGDALDLVGYLNGLPFGKGADRRPTLEWVEGRFGLRKVSDAERERIAARIAERRAIAEKRQRDNDMRQRSAAALTFHNAHKRLEASPAEIYLATRGVTLSAIAGRLDSCMRFAPRLEWWLGRDRRTGELGPEFPAIVTAMRGGDGKVQANHYTFLREDGAGKADVPKAKLMWPRTTGAVMRVGLGAGALDPEAAAIEGRRGPCVLTEGLEDALTFVEADARVRVWAAGSLPGLLSVPDHACVSSWLVARDRDWGKPQAAALFEQAIGRLEATGKPVQVLEPISGKDFNDMVKPEGDEDGQD